MLRAAKATDPAYQAAVVDIAANLHGRAKDDLVGEQIRQHRKRRRSIAAAAVALVLLTLTSIMTAGAAVTQQNEAQAQARVASERARMATSRQFLAQARAVVNDDPRSALQLGEAAQRLNPSPEIKSGLAQLVRSTPYLGTLGGYDREVEGARFSPDGRTLLTADITGAVTLWDLHDSTHPRRTFSAPGGDGTYSGFASDGRILATDNLDGRVTVWDMRDPASPHT